VAKGFGVAAELRSLLNGAHRWVKDAVQDVKDGIPFPMCGIDSDNGGEFINQQLIDWCAENSVQFTRGRPYRKTDNCFVERKNGDRVRKTIGYHRFDTEAEQAALARLDQIRQEKERLLRGENGGPLG
jgi:hypothetical protein